ncbi:MAG: energy coupling factor transporter S component ThiW [Chloroflexi bacterium]|nr:energy coupling factor transporter S component ThiW [Chloroflexota bacterium]
MRTWSRGERLPEVQRLALAAAFVALGVVLSAFSVPVGPARVFPFQHTINVLAGALLGPWYAVLTAFGVSVLRNALGTGTFLAFPGSMFGAFVVGYFYHHVRRTDLAAFLEPIGTAVIGALVGYALIAPLDAPALLLGFVRANPASTTPYLGLFTGALALVVSFAVSSVPGATLGYLCLRALRRAGIGLASRPSPSAL